MKKYSFICLLMLAGCFLQACSENTGPDHTTHKFSSRKAPGSSARAFLTADRFKNLWVEVDYMSGYKPTSEALNDLKSFLRARLHKSKITIATPTKIASGGQNAYTISDIRKLEAKNRDHYTSGNSSTLDAYFIIVDGKNANQSNVVGVAYYNTSMALFGKTIKEVTTGIVAPSRAKVEGTVFEHEFGHILGLVGNGTPVQSDHKTAEGHHCTTDGCLMQPAIETSNFFENIFDDTIPSLDAKCIRDLQANGGK